MAQILLKNIRSGKPVATIVFTSKITKEQLKKGLPPLRIQLKKRFTVIIENWKSNVKFLSRTIIKSQWAGINVFPAGDEFEIWNYVDSGTPEHTITAINKPTLKFQGTYTPKTTVSGPTFGGSGISSGDWRSPISVTQSIKARKFTLTISDKFEPIFITQVIDMFKQTAKIINRQ